jgi:signal transduction histidine kinase
VRSSRLAWTVVGIGGLLAVFAIVLSVRNSTFSDDPLSLLSLLMLVTYATVGGLVATRLPSNPIGWLMLLVAVSVLLGGLSSEYSKYALQTAPGSLPFGIEAAWLSGWSFFGAMGIPLVLLLFPTGHPPSPRWRVVGGALIASIIALCLVAMMSPAPIDVSDTLTIRNPYGLESLRTALSVAAWIFGPSVAALSIASVLSLYLRFRRSTGDERQQLKWLAYAAAISGAALVFVLITAIGVPPGGSSPLNDFAFLLLFLGIAFAIPLAIVVALLKYRLYDLDLVIKKTVLYVTVAALLFAAFAVVALVVGGIVGRTETGTALAAGAIGLLFWPALRLARRIADRVVYGGRATPYEVLSSFSEHLSETYSTDDVLPRTARLLAEATGAERSTIWLRVGNLLRPAATWPEGIAASEPVPSDGTELPWLPAEWAEEVRDRGELLGALAVDMPANDPINPARQRLVRDLAAQAGLVLRNVRLIEELRDSRRRIVGAQDERAKRLERNIHDGAQQQLVALAVKLRLASSMVEGDPARARTLLEQLQSEANDALENLRDLARGIYPPLLADKGLSAAIAAQANKGAIPVHVEMVNVGRYAQEVESAVYFSVLEALSNSAKYANASAATVAVTGVDGRLTFEVRDDGSGFDPAAVRGSGLQGMADRLDAIGGTLEIRSAPGDGTTIAGIVTVGASPGR